MENLINFLKELSQERNFEIFIYEEKKEVWMTGSNFGEKFDLVVRPIRNRYIKAVYETPAERIPVLFEDEEKAIKRIKKFFVEKEKVERSREIDIVEEKLNVEM